RVLGTVRYTEVDPTTGERRYLFEALECVDIPSFLDDNGGDPLPPPDPTDIQESVSKLLPLPGLAVDPSPDGLTGMDTYLWYDDDRAGSLEPNDHDNDPSTPARPGLSVTATAGPFTITAQAWIEEFVWDMGDGAVYRSTSAGTHDAPAATHMYETKGLYDVVTETVWRGSYTWSVGGLSGTGDLGTVTRSATHAYRVLESRAVLTG
ncbi:MAG: hypothetical protein ACRDUY_03420, partial [Nitriliruptorales bacterium]